MDLFKELFDSTALYSDSWAFPETVLENNCPQHKKKMLKEFLLQIKRKIASSLESFCLSNIVLVFESKINDNNTKRILTLSKRYIYSVILNCFSIQKDNDILEGLEFLKVDDINYCNILKDKLYKIKKELYDIANGKILIENTEFDLMYKRDFEDKNNLEVCGKSEFIEYLIQFLNDILPKIRALDVILDEEINLDILKSIVDSDELHLAMAFYLSESTLLTNKNVGTISEAIYFPLNYYECFKDSKPKVSAELYGKKYTFDDFLKIFEKIVFENPGLKIHYFPINEVKDKDLNYFKNIFKQREAQSISVNWEIIPAGEKFVLGNCPITTKNVKNTSFEVKRQNLIKIKIFLESILPLIVVNGINDFKGYNGYIYSNGAVILEKIFEYYNSPDDYKLSVDNATYVISIKDFVRLSKFSKSELIYRCKESNDYNVIRIYHDHKCNLSSWRKRIELVTSANDIVYLKEDIESYLNEESVVTYSQIKK